MTLPTPSWFERVAFASDVCSVAKAAPDGGSRLAAVECWGTQGLYPARFRFSGVVTWEAFSRNFPLLIRLVGLHEVTLD